MSLNTYLLLLLIEVIDDDSNEEIEGEEGSKDNEEDKVDVHVDVDLSDGLFPNLREREYQPRSFQMIVGYNIGNLNRSCLWVPTFSDTNELYVFLHRLSMISSMDINTHEHAVFTHPSTVDSCRHDVEPSFEDGHLKEGEVGLTHMVEGHGGCGPIGRLLCLVVHLAGNLVGDQVRTEPLPVGVYALHTKS